jgi:fructokinase
MNKITCFGEILWDNFPNYKIIGGAPLNVALRLKSFKNDVSIIGSVGADKDGWEIINYLRKNKINIEGLQIDEKFNTGIVQVTLNKEGSASYDISYPSAWDNIKITEGIKKQVSESDAFFYGSLAARNKISRDTLYELLKLPVYKILDLNLRPPHYNFELLLDLMKYADFIKLNKEELNGIIAGMGAKLNNLEASIKLISKITGTKTICITNGGEGSVLFFDTKFYYNYGHQIKVADTVGAGDSFLAALIDQLLKNKLPQKALDYASAVGASVASRQGANPELSNETIEEFLLK